MAEDLHPDADAPLVGIEERAVERGRGQPGVAGAEEEIQGRDALAVEGEVVGHHLGLDRADPPVAERFVDRGQS